MLVVLCARYRTFSAALMLLGLGASSGDDNNNNNITSELHEYSDTHHGQRKKLRHTAQHSYVMFYNVRCILYQTNALLMLILLLPATFPRGSRSQIVSKVLSG